MEADGCQSVCPVVGLLHSYVTHLDPERFSTLHLKFSEIHLLDTGQGVLLTTVHDRTHPLIFFFLVQTKMSWRSPLTSQYSRQPLRIKVQSCPVLR